jgi:hypothetical protein
MAAETKFEISDFADLLGRYCGYRWASECENDDVQRCYARNNESVKSFAECCDHLAPYTEPGAPDSYSAKDSLYLKYARRFLDRIDDLDKLPEFWLGFREAANDALDRKSTKRKAGEPPRRSQPG